MPATSPESSTIKRFLARHPQALRATALVVCFGLAFAAGLAYASWAMVCRAGRCPPAEALDSYEPRQTSKILAADGRFVAELGIERRTLIKLADIPPLVRNAFVVTEDKRFFDHSGIDWMRVPGALLTDIRHMSWNEGFSTITMQLARNIFPERISRDKSVVRKLKEAKVARDIEMRYKSKDKILELYLNQIYLGNGAYGISTAAQRYFGKSVAELNLAEMATLAALPKGPERYNPRISPERAVQRRNTVIGLMREAGYVTPAQASEAQAYPLKLATRVDAGEVAPYYVEWIREQLDDKFGKQLYEQGLKVYTTLDLDLQSAAERALERQLRAIEAGRYGSFPHQSYESYMAKGGDDEHASATTPYLQGAFIAMDPNTGAVRALVGGRDFDDSQFDRARQALRQPGSTFKPIVYADAIQNGRPLSYQLDDSPLTVQLANSAPWTPRNFEGDFVGPISLRRALYQSRNVPTIRLGMELGVQSVIDEARRFGITTPIPGYPSIFIGAAEVYPMELVSAYSAFATLGTRAVPMAITKVEDQQGRVLWENEPSTATVMNPAEAWLMVSVMKDVIQKGTAAGSVGSVFHAPAGGKTGTTNDGTNVWFVGYTSNLVAGVWMGFDKPVKIKANAQGGILAAPVWSAFMNEAYNRKPAPKDWPMPAGVNMLQVDISTNMLATPFCPKEVVANEYFIINTGPVLQCTVHTGMVDSTGAPILGVPPTGVSPMPPRIDSTRPGSTVIVVPGAATLRPGRPPTTDTSRAFRDSAIFRTPPRRDIIPRDTIRRDTTRRDTTRIRPRPDTTRRDSTGRDTTRRDTTRIRPKPDTTHFQAPK